MACSGPSRSAKACRRELRACGDRKILLENARTMDVKGDNRRRGCLCACCLIFGYNWKMTNSTAFILHTHTQHTPHMFKGWEREKKPPSHVNTTSTSSLVQFWSESIAVGFLPTKSFFYLFFTLFLGFQTTFFFVSCLNFYAVYFLYLFGMHDY